MQRNSLFAIGSIMASAVLFAACGQAEEEAPEEETAAAEPLAAPCPARVQDMRGTTEPLTCSCDAETAATGSVWGAGPYSDDSAVCRAAMHAGLVGDEPANVTINFLPGRESYTASDANGVQTSSWGRWAGSFAFEGAPVGEPAVEDDEEKAALDACPSNARELRGSGRTVSCSCTAEAASSGTVWGSGTYTDDSRICRAAVHAGVIGAEGGDISFTTVDGQEGYSGSTAHGVETRDYGSWQGSFTVAAAE